MPPKNLRFISYLTPSIPKAFYADLLDYLSGKLGVTSSLGTDFPQSGPQAVGRDPLTRGEADVAFLCAPAYIWLRDLNPSPIQILGAVPVYTDPRNEGKPVFFAEMVVEQDCGLNSFEDLEGCLFAYNDTQSLSGYFAPLLHLSEIGKPEHYFSSMIPSGSHVSSLEWIADGEVDTASIDSQAFKHFQENQPEKAAKLEVVHTLGPFPTHPIVVRSGLAPETKDALENALLAMKDDSAGSMILAKHHVSKFVPPLLEDYTREKLIASYGP